MALQDNILGCSAHVVRVVHGALRVKEFPSVFLATNIQGAKWAPIRAVLHQRHRRLEPQHGASGALEGGVCQTSIRWAQSPPGEVRIHSRRSGFLGALGVRKGAANAGGEGGGCAKASKTYGCG